MKKRARQAHRGESALEREIRLRFQAKQASRPEPWQVGPPDWWQQEQREFEQHLVETGRLLESRHG